jgi:hypothetical protein
MVRANSRLKGNNRPPSDAAGKTLQAIDFYEVFRQARIFAASPAATKPDSARIKVEKKQFLHLS